jgi:hypothetical protein
LALSTKWPTKFADKVSKRRHNEPKSLQQTVFYPTVWVVIRYFGLAGDGIEKD